MRRHSVGVPRERAAAVRRPLADGQRLAQFIYGTVIGLVALGSAGSGGVEVTGWQAAGRVVFGAMAVWVAHSYSELLSHRVVTGRRPAFEELHAGLRESWPIVLAGLLLSTPFLLTVLGLVPIGTAADVSRGIGILMLALIGFHAEQYGAHRWGRRLLHGALSAGLGLAVVGMELLVSH